MALEDLTGTDKFIDDFTITNPTSGDARSQGDDHIRGIKNVLNNCFPAITGQVTSTHTELNLLDGVTAILDGGVAETITANWTFGDASASYTLSIDHEAAAAEIGQLAFYEGGVYKWGFYHDFDTSMLRLWSQEVGADILTIVDASGEFAFNSDVKFGDGTTARRVEIDSPLAGHALLRFMENEVEQFSIGNNSTRSSFALYNEITDNFVFEVLTTGELIDFFGQVRGIDGGASGPTFTFTNDPNTGIYSHSADALGFTTAGVLAFRISSSQNLIMNTDKRILGSAGTAALPGIGFIDDTDSGMYYESTPDRISFAIAATKVFEISQGNLKMAALKEIILADGAAATPSLTFTSDVDTGLFWAATYLGVAVAGAEVAQFNASGLVADNWPESVLKTVTTDATTTSATPADITALSAFSVAAGEKYVIDGVLMVQNGSGGGLDFGWTEDFAAQASRMGYLSCDDQGNATGEVNATAEDITTEMTPTSVGSRHYHIRVQGYYYAHASSATTLDLQWSQSAPGGTATLHSGSWIRVTKIS